MRKKINTPPPPPKETRLKVAENIDLMSFLLAKMGGMSRSSIKSLLAHRQVMVNNEITTQFNFALKPNDNVIINSLRGNIELSHPKLKIIFEDQYLIVVEKKEGLLTVSTGKSDETTAFSILKNYVKKSATQNRIFVVHRIDRETSGIIVFAKTREIQLAMQEHWHEVVTRRVYVALVEGKVEKEKWNPNTRQTETLKEDASLAETFKTFVSSLPASAFAGSSSWEVRSFVDNENVTGSDKERNALIRERRKDSANDLFRKYVKGY